MFGTIGGPQGIGGPLSPDSIGGESFIRHVGNDKLIFDFHEGSGTTIHDKSHCGNDGTFGAGVAAPTWKRNSLYFDGGDYVNCGSSLALTKITVEACINFGVVNAYQYVASEDDNPSDVNRNWLFGLTNAGKFRISIFVSSVQKNKLEASTRTAGVNYHLIGTANGTNIRVFINGADDGNPTTYSGDIDTNTVNLWLGQNIAGNNPFTGYLLNARIYNRALSGIEIQQNYLVNKFSNN